ncbi:nephrin-like [Toxorhynchites rutilus septentrionalis]|uniref:nephrin-like n=1 Tax=Toxorhynchites rutilus septentrionalis TaxID=329112 RepID=UPI0024788DE4|nr:nephrin-like [Toxorhynchites rutilus septentrionalis]XP_055639842.1 nephrin-like [Toxorhynchites rutilus septentrionalis]XP_055639843.1 nephrin-like [Toxorhynchites rutilus septentrionalis]
MKEQLYPLLARGSGKQATVREKSKMKFNDIVNVLCYKLVLIVHLTDGKLVHEKDKHEPYSVEGVEGRSIELQCPITVPLSEVSMVLWFKDSAGIPLYSVDVRDRIARQPAHWSAPEVFGSRAKFNIDKSPASLLIKNLKRHDQGVYRCRIDFRTIQTQTYRYNLSVIVLPEQPVVLDRWGRLMNGTKIGPKEEGDDIVITCRVSGGRPQPEVRWLINGVIVDDQYEHNSGDIIENRLLWPTIQRSDLNSIFTCQTMNTRLVEAKETSYVLDLHLKPLSVALIDPPEAIVADKRYEVSCQSTGSRPNAIITWYKGKRQMRRAKDDILSHNTTISTLSFSPSTEDDGKTLTCRAENPNVNGLFLETTWKMNVVYPPIVSIQLGSTLAPDDIKEGDDVYFECHVKSNPIWKKLLWFHNDTLLLHNASARIIQSNQSLVLQKVVKQSAGYYACSAINGEGETVSNQQFLRVKHVPMCAGEKVVLIGASKNENVEILCEIYSDPPARSFHWRFNNSAEILEVDPHRYSNHGNFSVLQYTPVTEQDYGTLTCWASNEIGTQSEPCHFQVIFADYPSPVSNCTLYNRTQQFAEIQCAPGYDGGLPQMFVLELVSKFTGTRRFNFSNKHEPYFILDRLEKLSALMSLENNTLSCVVYAINQKGSSRGVIIPNFEIGHMHPLQAASKHSTEWLPIALGILLTLIILVLSIRTKAYLGQCWSNCRRGENKRTDMKIAQQTKNIVISNDFECGTNCLKLKNVQTHSHHQQHRNSLRKKNSSKESNDDEPDPDVIPAQFNIISSSPMISTPILTNRSKGDSYPFADFTTNSYYHNPIDLTNLGSSVGREHSDMMNHPVTSALESTSGSLPPITVPSAATVPISSGSELDINIIKDRLMTTRVPESCV